MQVTHTLNAPVRSLDTKQLPSLNHGQGPGWRLPTAQRGWRPHCRTLGIGPDDRVAILALNSDSYIECLYGIWWCGAVTIPLNYRFSVSEIVDLLQDCDVKVLIVDDALQSMVPTVRTEVLSITHIVHTGEASALEGIHEYEDLLAQSAPIAEVKRGNEDLASILYTSGTTGKPRGVMLTHSNLDANYFTLVSQDLVDDHTIYLHVTPMFHSADGMFIGGVTLVGGTHVVVSTFDVREVLKIISVHKVTTVLLVPTTLRLLLDGIDSEDHVFDLTGLRVVIYGASPMPTRLIERAIKTLPSVRFIQGYGMTELAPLASVLDPQYHTLVGPLSSQLRSAGRAAYIAEIMVADKDDNEVPRETIGEVLVRGHGVMKGYWKDPTFTEHVLRGGWMHTGDLGYMDDEGFIFVVDRLKDIIIFGEKMCTHSKSRMCSINFRKSQCVP